MGCPHEETPFVSLHDLDSISILSDEDSDLEEDIIHLFNEVSFLFLSLKKNKETKTKKSNKQALNILKTCTVIRGNFERFQVYFLAWQQNTIFLTNKESMILIKCLIKS